VEKLHRAIAAGLSIMTVMAMAWATAIAACRMALLPLLLPVKALPSPTPRVRFTLPQS
jgi:hypothetical protein